MATQAELARHLHVAQQTISKLKNAGILPAPASRGGYDLDACRGAYIGHLQAAAGGRDSSRPGSLEAERARLAKEQADLLERKNAKERGDVVSRSEVDANVTGMVSLVTSRLSLVGAHVAGADYRLRKRIDTAVNDALEELATISLDDVNAAVNGAQHNDLEENDDEQ
jgi:phage terminase Nu1 subunit (DNA packaging protein)